MIDGTFSKYNGSMLEAHLLQPKRSKPVKLNFIYHAQKVAKSYFHDQANLTISKRFVALFSYSRLEKY